MKPGCYTALITPFNEAGELDQEGLELLIDFQIQNGVTGILATGTTGESPTFKWKEHDHVIALVAKLAKNKCLRIAGTGSNNTAEALEAIGHAAREEVDAVLMVDPYYNGPSSLEIRREYYEVVAKKFPDMAIIPYIIPGRTGAQMLPQDLAILAENCKNVFCVKEATGNIENMKLTRKYCGNDFKILSGDDALIYNIMTDPEIKACGGISVMSNIAPKFLTQMVTLLNQGDTNGAAKLQAALKPLLDLVVVTTQEDCQFGPVSCRARNPLPLKTLMQLLGMPSGPCRKPLGKMTQNGFQVLLDAAKSVQANTPEIFEPIAAFFNVDIEKRLTDPKFQEGLWYTY
ncbi:MAG: 4-hydroxy-tetrahydrodipicolinate synthase [Proteobacteria bacterium]|nr:4-hydroxy-tetrahydrodipicolinate synthase [Pseudomonadota bacterium]MBU1581613.1 4-hydroxy-tetrahydrodipicolinate synthase [Pseudomonadota bacterium]MBU2455768.1 4-hydroxy-tetrahydrodipicolinate synthase [Pseudomonadota bacterium]MBU2629844.1 4-hydroxy-tetrahydrodipicolinate synthase [Pseudomonadota bacterium]